LDNIHPTGEFGYFGINCKPIDEYLNNTYWKDGVIFSCEKDKKVFDVIIWRKSIGIDSTAHGRHVDKNCKIDFNINDLIYLKYNDYRLLNELNTYKDKKLLSIDYNFCEKKKIIICGNGADGYEENISNKFIDSHDIIVRINSYKIIPKISGTKTTIHYIGSINRGFHSEDDPPFPEFNKGEYIFLQNEDHKKKLISMGFEIKNNLVFLNRGILHRINKTAFNSKAIMSGTIIFTLFILIKLNVDCEINYIGFSNHKIKNNKQSYYWGDREIKNDINKTLHNKHNFDSQYKMMLLIDNIFNKIDS
jgi:hypothetical protein